MLRAIDQPYAAGVDMFLLRPWWSIGLSGRPMVPRPRRYSRPNRASRPSDAISLLYPSLLPGHQPVHPSLSLSSTVLNRARALRRAISKFPTIKKKIDIAYLPSLLLASLSSLTHCRTCPVIRLPGHVSGRDSQRTGESNRSKGRNPDTT